MNFKLWLIIFFTTFKFMQINSISIKVRCNSIRYAMYFSEPEILTECSGKYLKILRQNETVEDMEITRSLISYSSNPKKLTLTISSSVVYYIPFGIEHKLINLTSLSIKYSKLREIHQYNLEPFTELTTLSLEGNEIQVIEQNLFNFNPKLTDITLEHNHIQHVAPDVFSELQHLERIYFNYNPCVMHTNYDHWKRVNITTEIYQNCKPRVDDTSNWKASEEPEDQATNCSCSGLLAFTVILGLIIIFVPFFIVFYFYKFRKMSLVEMKQSLVQFSSINEHL